MGLNGFLQMGENALFALSLVAIIVVGGCELAFLRIGVGRTHVYDEANFRPDMVPDRLELCLPLAMLFVNAIVCAYVASEIGGWTLPLMVGAACGINVIGICLATNKYKARYLVVGQEGMRIYTWEKGYEIKTEDIEAVERKIKGRGAEALTIYTTYKTPNKIRVKSRKNGKDDGCLVAREYLARNVEAKRLVGFEDVMDAGLR